MKHISLSVKVIILIIAFVGAGGLVTAATVYTNSSNALQDSISKNQLATAQQTTDKLDRFMYERETEIDAGTSWQQLPNFLAGTNTSATRTNVEHTLRSMKSVTASWNEIAVFDTSGHLYASSEGVQPNGKYQIDPAVASTFKQAAAGALAYSDAFVTDDRSQVSVAFMAPIRSTTNGDETVGVLVGELAWPTVLEILQSIDSSHATLLSSKGLLLGTSSSNDVQAGILIKNLSQSAVFKASQLNISGSEVVTGLMTKQSQVTSFVKEAGYLNYHGNSWVLALETPKSVAYKPAVDLARSLVVTFFVILIGSVLILLLGLHRLVIEPIQQMRKAVRRLAAGDFSEAVVINSHDELGDLGHGFNEMANKLQHAYGSLQASINVAQEEKRLLTTLLESLPVGVMVIDARNGNLVLINRAAEEITGNQAAKLLAKSNYIDAYKIVKEDGSPYPNEERPLSIAIRTGKRALKEDMYVLRPDGIKVAIRSVASPIIQQNHETNLAVTVFEDISKERNLERSREEFFSIASHELRTPLTAIRGNTSLIQDHFGEQLSDPDLKEMIGDIHESSTRLIEIVNDFLDTSRLEQDRMKYNLQPVDLTELAEEVVKEYQVTGSRLMIHLEVNHPEAHLPKAMADRNRAKQVLINLLGNALKFTDAGSVTISFEVQDGYVKTIVTDTGKGIAAEAQRFLFKKFEQSGKNVLTRDSVRGTGLGLYISKMLTEQMNGHINLERSELGVGTTFAFSLPIAADGEATTPKPPSNRSLPPTTRPPLSNGQ